MIAFPGQSNPTSSRPAWASGSLIRPLLEKTILSTHPTALLPSYRAYLLDPVNAAFLAAYRAAWGGAAVTPS